MIALLVAIDGPAGAGKSTLARRLAAALGLPYINTGAMYRGLAAAALRRGVEPTDGAGLAALFSGMKFEISRSEDPPALWIDGAPPSPDLATPQVEGCVSLVSSHAAVRTLMREEQRRLGADGGVMEGRDIGSAVAPDASVKIYLVAAEDERVVRRTLEREGADPTGTGEALRTRDALDSEVNPFVPAQDAALIDTTGRDPEDVFGEALALVRGNASRA